MGRIFAFGLMGALLGFLFPSLGFSGRPPLPPARWTSSTLLREFRKAEERARDDASAAPGPGNPIALIRSQPPERHLREAREADSHFQNPPRAIFGRVLTLASLPPGQRELAIFQGCSGNGENDCCVEYLEKVAETGNWEMGGGGGGLETEGFPKDGRWVHFHFGAPYEKGLPFLHWVYEIPLGSERETKLWGFDPDDKTWKVQGSIEWQATPMGKRCEWRRM